MTILVVYVDDMMVIGYDFEEIEDLKDKLAKEFELKTWEVLDIFLAYNRKGEYMCFKESTFLIF